ncbi:MAG: GerMN domain-containing protein [Actinomycetota bacterium]
MIKKFSTLHSHFGPKSVLVLSLIIFTTSCGVPTSSELIQIPDANIPFELNATSTTTTTTTLPLDLEVNKSGSNSKNAVSEIVNETVDLYFIIANRLVATKIQIVSPATTTQVLSALVAGPPSGDAGSGLRSAIASSLQAKIIVTKGIVVIDANNFLLAGLSPIDQRLAIAQLVLTFTSRPGIGQAKFSVNGVSIAVPRGRGDLSKPGDAVSYDDYISLLADRNG